MFKKQISRFLLVGVSNTIIGYLVFASLTYLNVFYGLALAVAYVFGIVNSYFWNRRWTFGSNGKKRKELPRFISVYVTTYIVNLGLLAVFIEKLGIDPIISQAFVLPLIAIMSFIGHKHWSFG